jgi:hypothetical protein
MSSKKNTPAALNTNVPALKIGSRLRCTDDGAQGRIIWANGTSVKIQWDDGEQVTWRRDALASRPIDILDSAAARNECSPTEAPGEVSDSEQNVATELPETNPQQMPGVVVQDPVAGAFAAPTPQAQEQRQVATEVLVSEPVSLTTERRDDTPADRAPTSSIPAKPKRQRKAAERPRESRLSALDAAARVLTEEGRAMTCQEMIDVMAARGYWTSPKGATPQGTLYSAILRELTAKGNSARFQKVERGKFARRGGA